MHTQYNYKKKRIKSLPILLRNPEILVIGGGKVALEKAIVLYKNNIQFRMISKIFDSEIKYYCESIVEKEFNIADMKTTEIVIDATGNEKVRKILLKEKSERNFLLNRVDEPKDCDFYFSSLLQYNNLKIAISSDGASPRLTQLVRDKIKNFIPKDISTLAYHKQSERIENIIELDSLPKVVNNIFGKVSIVGCGPGDPELLTLRAYKTIQNGEVFLCDRLISSEIIDLIPKEAKMINVGKEYGKKSITQEEINLLLLHEANRGKNVVRLKGGDPYIFGRGAEEAEFLKINGIQVEVIPGLSSALTGPASLGIPPTARNYSAIVTIVSCSLNNGETNLDWLNLLNNINHTVIVLMGLHKVNEIIKKACVIGIDSDTKVAIISNATTRKQKIIKTRLNSLQENAKSVERPALLVFGKVLDYSKILPNYHFSDHNTKFGIELKEKELEKEFMLVDQIQ